MRSLEQAAGRSRPKPIKSLRLCTGDAGAAGTELEGKGSTMADAGIVLGVDVGKRFHYAWAQERGTGEVVLKGRVDNAEADLLEAISRVVGIAGAPENVLVVVDQPNNIGALALRAALSLGCEVAFIPGDAMRREADRMGLTSKTDRVDAMAICRAAVESPQLLRPVCTDPTKSRVRALRARDADLMHDETRAVNRLRDALLTLMPEFEAALDGDRVRCGLVLALLSRFGGPWSMRRHLGAVRTFISKWRGKVPAGLAEGIVSVLGRAALEPEGMAGAEAAFVGAVARDLARIMDERAALDSEVRRLLADDVDFNNLLTVPGVGARTAAAIVADVEIERFDDAFKLARYMGVAPKVARSGTSVRRTWSDRRGNERLRHAMFCSAFAAIRCDAQSHAFYCRKRSEGKTYAAAILALARKRAKVIYAILRDGRPYEEREWESTAKAA